MKIAPALTAEQWAEYVLDDAESLADTLPGGATGPLGEGLPRIIDAQLCITYDHGVVEQEIAREQLPVVIALANAALPDNDPRKVSWAIVDQLRMLADKANHYEDEGPAPQGWQSAQLSASIANARGLADILSSYLPPRETNATS